MPRPLEIQAHAIFLICLRTTLLYLLAGVGLDLDNVVMDFRYLIGVSELKLNILQFDVGVKF